MMPGPGDESLALFISRFYRRVCRLYHGVITVPRELVAGAVLLFAGLFSPIPSYADWINLSGAETSPNIAEISYPFQGQPAETTHR